jgi:hypothetical protein
VRFCPFCSAENPSEATQCASCGRRLPPLPPRRGKTPSSSPEGAPIGVPGASGTTAAGTAPPVAGTGSPGSNDASTPAAPSDAQARRALLASLVPPPSSQRRGAPSEIRPPGVDARRRGDVTAPLPPPPVQPAPAPAPVPAPLARPPTVDYDAPTVQRPAQPFFEDEGATEIRDPLFAAPAPALAAAPARPNDLSEVLRRFETGADTVIDPEPQFADRLGSPSPTPTPAPLGPVPTRTQGTPSGPARLEPPPTGPAAPRSKAPSAPPPVVPAPRSKAPSVPPPVVAGQGSPSRPGPLGAPPTGPQTLGPPPTGPQRAPLRSAPARADRTGGIGAHLGTGEPIEPSLPELDLDEDDDNPKNPTPLRARSGSIPIPQMAPPTRALQAPKLPPTPSVASPARAPTHPDPPPTRIARPDALIDRPFTPPQVMPIPELPEPGPINAARYSIMFVRARWQRGGAIRLLHEEIRQDTSALDQVLGTLGRAARNVQADNRTLAAENAAIDEAEARRTRLEQAQLELSARKNDETARAEEIERERIAKVTESERTVDDAQAELANLDAQRRSLRDKRKDVERRQKAYLKAAEDRDGEAGSAELGETHQALRRQAEEHRREAAGLEPERQELDRKLAALDRPQAQAQARLDATKAELDTARRSLNDAREGHRHRLAEIDAEQARKVRELHQAEAEIQRRLVTLGTLINLNRIERPEFSELYERIDRLRGAIGSRQTEIEKLTAERDSADRGALVRGAVVIGGGVVVLITLIVILLALI